MCNLPCMKILRGSLKYHKTCYYTQAQVQNVLTCVCTRSIWFCGKVINPWHGHCTRGSCTRLREVFIPTQLYDGRDTWVLSRRRIVVGRSNPLTLSFQTRLMVKPLADWVETPTSRSLFGLPDACPAFLTVTMTSNPPSQVSTQNICILV